MLWGQITVGTQPVQLAGPGVTGANGTIPAGTTIVNGLRLLGSSANTGTPYVGGSSAITTSSGSNPVAQGTGTTQALAAGTVAPVTVPAHHLQSTTNQVWLVADAPGQVVFWSAD